MSEEEYKHVIDFLKKYHLRESINSVKDVLKNDFNIYRRCLINKIHISDVVKILSDCIDDKLSVEEYIKILENHNIKKY